MGECFGSWLPCPPIPRLCSRGVAWVPCPLSLIAVGASSLIPSCPQHLGTGAAGLEETPHRGDFVSLQRVSLLRRAGGGSLRHHPWGPQGCLGVPGGTQGPCIRIQCPWGAWPGCRDNDACEGRQPWMAPQGHHRVPQMSQHVGPGWVRVAGSWAGAGAAPDPELLCARSPPAPALSPPVHGLSPRPVPWLCPDCALPTRLFWVHECDQDPSWGHPYQGDGQEPQLPR